MNLSDYKSITVTFNGIPVTFNGIPVGTVKKMGLPTAKFKVEQKYKNGWGEPCWIDAEDWSVYFNTKEEA